VRGPAQQDVQPGRGAAVRPPQRFRYYECYIFEVFKSQCLDQRMPD
jgi:hypothetical protein